jgi:hypothetical protein
MGVGGVTIIAHGSSNARAIRNAVKAAANEPLAHQVNAEIIAMLARVPADAMVAKPSGKGIRGLFERMRGRLHRHRDVSGENVSRKTGPLGQADYGDHPHGADVVLRTEAEMDPHMYGVRADSAPKPLNGKVKLPGDHHEPADGAEAEEPKPVVRDDPAAADPKKP